jgi:hypothetical protein
VVSVDPLSHALVVTVGQRRCAPQRCWTRRGSEARRRSPGSSSPLLVRNTRPPILGRSRPRYRAVPPARGRRQG